MSADSAFTHAKEQLEKNGGVATVILGRDQDVPTAWSRHPRIHFTVASELSRHTIGTGIPSNTRIVVFTDAIDPTIYKHLQKERDRRHLPYFARKTAAAACEELGTHWFADLPRQVPQVAPAPVALPTPPALEALAESVEPVDVPPIVAEPIDEKRHNAGKGEVAAFLAKHANLSPVVSNADEARRLLPLMKAAGINSTFMSICNALGILKRKKGLGSRPESVAKEPLARTAGTLADEIGQAIAALTRAQTIAQTYDDALTKLRKENADLTAKMALLREALAV